MRSFIPCVLAAAVVLLLSAACVHDQAAAFDPVETCEGKAEGAECWKQLDNHSGCHVWNGYHRKAETASWTGACNGSVAEGEGVLTWAGREDTSVYKGALVGGRHGRGRGRETNSDGTVFEGAYANGQRSGLWRETTTAGTVAESTYANGRLVRWVARYANGDVMDTPRVNGEIHGTAVWREANGDVSETPYVNGKEHGTAVRRRANGDVWETPYVNGKIHGTAVRRYANGDVSETPYVNGEIHGTAVRRFANGDVIEYPAR